MPKLNCLAAFVLLGAAMLGARAQDRNFITVEGANLRARLESARRSGSAGAQQQSHFWTAYSFGVRPGVAVDIEIVGDDGSRSYFSGTNLVVNGAPLETRNLGVFLLHEAGTGAVVRLEIYNLDRRRDFGTLPVYWLGRAGNEESLSLLKEIIDAGRSAEAAAGAARAIGLHDDRRVDVLLEDLARNSAVERVRTQAISWLGMPPLTPARQSVLTELARSEQESAAVRRKAVSALSRSRDAATLAGLQGLYATVRDGEVRRTIISAIARNEAREAAVGFLLKVAAGDDDVEMKKRAIQHLGQIAGERTLGALAGMAVQTDAETEVQKQAVAAISRRPREESIPLLIKFARTHPKPEVRKQAIHLLARTGDERAVEFFREMLLK